MLKKRYELILEPSYKKAKKIIKQGGEGGDDGDADGTSSLNTASENDNDGDKSTSSDTPATPSVSDSGNGGTSSKDTSSKIKNFVSPDSINAIIENDAEKGTEQEEIDDRDER